MSSRNVGTNLNLPPSAHPSDPGRGPLILGLTWLLTCCCILVIALRFYVRARVSRMVGFDDWLMMVAVVLQLIFQACITRGYTYGLGKYDQDLAYDELVNILKWMWISTTPAILASTTARISIAVLLIRIFGMHTWLKWFLVGFTAIQTISGCLIIIFVWVQVSPVQGLWDPSVPAQRWNPDVQKYTSFLGQSMFTFSDLTYVLFPVVIIWNLNMPLRRKIGLVCLLALSLVTMGASIMKTLTSQTNSLDPNKQYNASISILWSAIEQGLVIIMGCIPPLRAIVRSQYASCSCLRPFLGSWAMKTPNSKGRGTSAYSNIEIELDP